MRDELYLRIKKPSLRFAYFLYFDVEPFLADQLFIRRKIRVWFDSHYAKQGAPYLGILCHVRKKNVPAFLAALEDLKKSMLICGRVDYAEYVSAFLDKLERTKEESLNGKNGSAGKAVQGQPA